MADQKKRLEEERRKNLNQIEVLKKDDPFADPGHTSDNAAVDTDVREQVGHDTIEAEIKDMKKRVGMDVLSRLTQRANSSLMQAVSKAKELKLQYIDTEHVLWGLLQDSSIYQLISECKAMPSEIKTDLEKAKAIIRELMFEVYTIALLLNPIMHKTSKIIKEAVLANKKPNNLFNRLDV